MNSYQNIKIADQYLLQRIESASPEQLHAMLLEAGQKFLIHAIDAMNANDLPAKARHFSRVTEIIIELSGRLNQEQGGELVANLTRIYSWWIDVLFDASQKNLPEPLQVVQKQMGEMRASWEELHHRKVATAQPETKRVSLDGLVG